MKPLDATSKDFDQTIAGEKPVVVDFWAPWCVWCKKLAPIYDQLAEKHSEFTFVKVNVETESKLAERYGISSLPTLKFFCEGREIGEQIGATPREKLEGLLKSMFADHKACLASSSPAR